MAWQKYKLVFKLLSPLHVGYRKVGNLLQTRKYVPGKVIWAALTARLTRDYADGRNANNYREIGNLLKQHFRFGYLYPALLKENKTDVVAPDDVDEYFFWKKESEFDYRFLNSYASTALNYDLQSAEEGSLHEVEFIAPKTRPWDNEESARQVYLKGEIYIDESQALPQPLNHWQDVINKLQIGAERNAGWGRLELILLTDPQPRTIEIEIDKGQPVRAHVLAVNSASTSANNALEIQGDLEPLLGWERAPENRQGRQWQLSPSPLVCFTPGSRVTDKMKFIITEHYGLLKPV